MATINRFEDLHIWQKAREICQNVFELCKHENFARDFILKDQIKRSSGSVMDNIAEGHGRDGNTEFKHFLSIAKGSLNEVKSQLYRALDSCYIVTLEFNDVYEKCDKLAARIGKFIQYIKSSDYKGTKF